MKVSKIALLALAGIAGTIILAGCSSSENTISAKELFDCDKYGLSGNADIYPKLSYEAKQKISNGILERNKGETAEDKSVRNKISDNLYYFYNSIEYKIKSDKKTDFKNGDEIEIEAKCNEKYAKSLNVKLVDTTFKYTVSGLEEGTVYDPFEGLKVTFTGIEPNVSAEIDKSGCAQYVQDHVYFYFDDSGYDLSNGDEVTVIASYSEYDINDDGVQFSKDRNTYTVSGALGYPETLDSVDLTKVDKQFSDMLESKALSNFLVGSEVSTYYATNEYTYMKVTSAVPTVKLKTYLRAKSMSSYSTNNRYICIWTIKVDGVVSDPSYDSKYKEGDKVSFNDYFVAYIDNIPTDSDGKIPSDYMNDYDYRTYDIGEVTYEELYNSWVTSQKADYVINDMYLATETVEESSAEESSGASKPAESSAEASETSKQTSETSKETSETSKQTSETSKETSETSKQASETSKETSETSKQASDTSAESSETSAASSESSAESSETSKEASEESAEKSE